MKKTYLVTVDIDEDAMASVGADPESGPLLALVASIADNRFLHNAIVRLAPDSFQPRITPDIDVRYNGVRLGVEVEPVDYVSRHPDINEGSTEE